MPSSPSSSGTISTRSQKADAAASRVSKGKERKTLKPLSKVVVIPTRRTSARLTKGSAVEDEDEEDEADSDDEIPMDLSPPVLRGREKTEEKMKNKTKPSGGVNLRQTTAVLTRQALRSMPKPYVVLNPDMLDSAFWTPKRLRRLCTSLRLKCSGNREVLISRMLRWHRHETDSPPAEEAEENTGRGNKGKEKQGGKKNQKEGRKSKRLMRSDTFPLEGIDLDTDEDMNPPQSPPHFTVEEEELEEKARGYVSEAITALVNAIGSVLSRRCRPSGSQAEPAAAAAAADSGEETEEGDTSAAEEAAEELLGDRYQTGRFLSLPVPELSRQSADVASCPELRASIATLESATSASAPSSAGGPRRLFFGGIRGGAPLRSILRRTGKEEAVKGIGKGKKALKAKTGKGKGVLQILPRILPRRGVGQQGAGSRGGEGGGGGPPSPTNSSSSSSSASASASASTAVGDGDADAHLSLGRRRVTFGLLNQVQLVHRKGPSEEPKNLRDRRQSVVDEGIRLRAEASRAARNLAEQKRWLAGFESFLAE
uniref:SAP domain-containing protein n=1 Tax=Chromera velia CCMP2878 TaxID=1169474 RepID=A0A0G4GAC2_9ALVE|eukprot:Cvel_4419.t1-p1 / transcript=Cvel_4419.t1 / gene=Cvel_4419 / organism=Chromera_velia_CCMP2878 / gene_product=hypothetical protein / transcript_product=hypothetical protein / location=Cvel_scaffold192:62495-66575(+) / protein_length=540 / sequence_SO=supercontig / SO=protein_coding / is_pseudo=false